MTDSNVTDFDWYVACTPPSREAAVVDYLAQNDIAGLLPVKRLWRKKTRYQKKKVLKTYPLMPGYVLVGVTDYGQLSALWKLPDLISGFITMDGRALTVPHEQVQRLVDWGSTYQPPSAHAYMQTNKEFSAGDEVRVTDGPLMDRQFKVKKITGDKAQVFLELFGRTHDVSIELDILVPI